MTELEEIEHWLSLQSPKVRKNAKIVTPEDLGVKHLFRIDKEKQKEYIPRLAQTAIGDDEIENSSTPRICMGRSLLGCLVGYGRWMDDIYESLDKRSIKLSGYRGGYIVQTIPFNYAIAITSRLLWEANDTGEVWLVAYNSKTSTYKSEAIGKLFCRSLQLVPKAGDAPLMESEFYLEHDYKEGLPLLDGADGCEPGHYRILTKYGDLGRSGKHCNSKDKDLYEITQITESDYKDAKSYSAALLSLGTPPVNLSW